MLYIKVYRHGHQLRGRLEGPVFVESAQRRTIGNCGGQLPVRIIVISLSP
jgi:hypothetical protein